MIAPLAFVVLAAAAAPSSGSHPMTAPTERCCAALELRQYTLKPGQRDVLIDLFEHEFVESQEAIGIRLVGHFRDTDRPDRFVWIRGFPDMPARAEMLGAFYFGPVWQAHRETANATMLDSDNVLLLKPAAADTGFEPRDAKSRAPVDTTVVPTSRVLATIYSFDAPVDAAFKTFFASEIEPAVTAAGAKPIAQLESESAENNFPRLPIRSRDHVFVWFARFDDAASLHAYESKLAASSEWSTRLQPALRKRLSADPERLELEPAARSLLR